MIEVILNDRLGKKIRVKCNEDDTIGDLKKLVAAQTGRAWSRGSGVDLDAACGGREGGSCVCRRRGEVWCSGVGG
jgi:hypothetical protein